MRFIKDTLSVVREFMIVIGAFMIMAFLFISVYGMVKFIAEQFA